MRIPTIRNPYAVRIEMVKSADAFSLRIERNGLIVVIGKVYMVFMGSKGVFRPPGERSEHTLC